MAWVGIAVQNYVAWMVGNTQIDKHLKDEIRHKQEVPMLSVKQIFERALTSRAEMGEEELAA